MKIFILGANGQLGKELIKKSPSAFEISSFSKNEFNLSELDFCKDKILDLKPNWIINAAAYTQVDNAEEDIKTAYKINTTAVELLAKTVSSYGGRLLQISTDFVFDGMQSKPYSPKDICNPINVYGQTKLMGEKLSLKYKGTLVLRTSWLYGNFGNNFFLKIFNLHKFHESDSKEIKIVNDQIGCPTNTDNLASICWELIKKAEIKTPTEKIFHWCNSGVTSWYDFAKSIGEISAEMGLIKNPAPLKAINSYQYNSLAKRPKYSVLNCSSTMEFLNLKQIDWEEALRFTLYQKLNKEKNT